MDRRAYLSLGVGAMAAIAGCSDETDFEEGNTGGNGNGDSDSSGDSDDALEILEHELVRENAGSASETVSVEGRAENVGDQQLSYVEVRARFYNEAGDQLDSSLDNTNDLDPGTTWAFEIQHFAIGEDAAEVADYDIGVGTEF
jgi:hypothetical protein